MKWWAILIVSSPAVSEKWYLSEFFFLSKNALRISIVSCWFSWSLLVILQLQFVFRNRFSHQSQEKGQLQILWLHIQYGIRHFEYLAILRSSYQSQDFPICYSAKSMIFHFFLKWNSNPHKNGFLVLCRCAGEVAAVAFNEYCGVGVAYNASIGGIKNVNLMCK